MRAVNLIPAEGRRGGPGVGSLPTGPGYAVLAVLALAVGLVTLYVLTGNTVSDRKAQLASLNAQVAQAQARATQLTKYKQFAQLAQARATTVREIAETRFDWYGALADLSRVVPADTSLQSLFASVAPGASSGSGSSGASSSLRGDISAPAFELTGCTKSQDDVARLMSRLRLIDGVTRVTLGDSQKGGGSSGTSGAGSCGANAPTFDIVVFFQPLPGATPTGAGPLSSGSTPTPSSSSTTTTSTTTTTPSAGGSS